MKLTKFSDKTGTVKNIKLLKSLSVMIIIFATYGIQVLQSMQGGFVINQISRSFEALFTESTLISFRHLVNVPNVLFQRI